MNSQLHNSPPSSEREPISAFVICYNEERHIAACLESLSFCDEIVVIDSFSKDATPEIARAAGAKVIQHPWLGYRGQKEFGLKAVTHEWVINLDADERVNTELRDEILRVLREAKNTGISSKSDAVVGYFILRVVYHLGRWWRSGGWHPEYRLRFFRKSKVTWGGTDPHEKVIVKGKTERIKGEILHYTYRDLSDQFCRLENFSSVAAEEDFRGGKKFTLSQLLVSPIVRTLKFYLVKKGYREGVAGIIVALAEGYYTFMKYAKLWEKHYYAAHPKEEVIEQKIANG